MALLTKSLFVHSLDCPTKLYYKTKPELYVTNQDDNEFLQALAEGGIQVGELAKFYMPGGIEIEYSKDKEETLRKTAELLKKDQVVIYEAGISYEGTYALVDILEKVDNRINLIEVKSKSYSSDTDFLNRNSEIIPEWQKYLYDIAFQTWIMRKACPGYDIHSYLYLVDKDKECSINGLHQHFEIKTGEDGRNKIKVRPGIQSSDLGEPIMRRVNVDAYVQIILDGNGREPLSDLERMGFDEWISGLSGLLQDDQKYEPKISTVCKNCEHRVEASKLGGKTCGFRQCWSEALGWSETDFEKPHAFDVWQIRAANLLENELYFMSEITPGFLNLGNFDLDNKTELGNGYRDRQLLQAMKMTGRLCGDEVVLPGLFKEMEKWVYPLHFIDFEGIAPAIPLHIGMKPYKKTPFQFSIHSVLEDGTVNHTTEWLETRKNQFPCFTFIRNLKQALENDNGSVFMYHHYERTTLNDVKAMLENSNEPDRGELIDFIHSLTDDNSPRMLIDQQKLVRKYYYSIHMGKSNSIKDVLPAVLQESSFLRQYYSNPYSGLSIKETILYQSDESGNLLNPYDLLDPITISEYQTTELDYFIENNENMKINDGGAAMMAWIRMQFDDVSEAERNAVFDSLLRYCELDTLAMVMIYQHWKSL